MRDRPSTLGRRIIAGAAALAVGVLSVTGCASDPEPQRSTVTPESAYVAIVQWELEQIEPVLDEDGNVQPPVVYLASQLGGTIDAGVQAEVVASIDDAAVIRFADDPRDARDEGLPGEPVKDDGVMLVLDEFEVGLPVIEARISRYRSADDVEAWQLEVTARDETADVTSADPVEAADG